MEFETGRKKPLTFITCFDCKQKIHPKAFVQLCGKDTLRRYEAYMRTIPSTTNPTELKQFGYHFDEQGRLRTIEGDYSFHYVSETHYSRVGDFISKHIQKLMVEKYGLEEKWISSEEQGAKTNIFVSPNLKEYDHIVLLIQV